MHTTSLGRLILVHELAFLMLVFLVGMMGGASAYFWHQTSEESVRVHQLLHLGDRVRSEVTRQVQQLIRARLMRDATAAVSYMARAREVDQLFNSMRRLGADRAEDQAIQVLQAQYRVLQRDMNALFSLPLERRAGAQVRLLDPRFAAAMEETFAQRHRQLVHLMEQKATRLAQRTVTFRRWAQVLIPASLLGACLLVLYSRRVLRRQFLLPMQRLKEGSRILSSGRLEHRLPSGGTEEVRELTQALNDMSGELLQSRRALVQQERQAALGALTPVVAHNIRNPLASIRAVAQLLSPGLEADEFAEGRQSIIDTTDRLSRWVNALVSYLHPLQPKPRELPLVEVVEAALAMLRDRLEGRRLVLLRLGWEQSLRVQVDPDLMEQALYSLLANAVDASPEGAELVVRLSEEQGQPLVHIRDHGPGMPFMPDPAADLSPGPSTKRFGTGLGIPIASKILQAHGWELRFQGAEGGGTAVCVRGQARTGYDQGMSRQENGAGATHEE